MKAKRVAIYTRVSTDDQTIANQLRDLRKVAKDRGWSIVAEYQDEGVSGAKGRDKRPGLDQLLKDVQQGKCNLVAAWAIDRIGRSLPHLVTLLGELQAVHCDLYLHQQNIDTSTPAGKLFYAMTGAFAEFELGMIRERILAGMARAREQGTRSGLPVGHPKVTAGVERRILQLRAQGMGKTKIARTLECGVSTVMRVCAEHGKGTLPDEAFAKAMLANAGSAKAALRNAAPESLQLPIPAVPPQVPRDVARLKRELERRQAVLEEIRHGKQSRVGLRREVSAHLCLDALLLEVSGSERE
jgi:DNA invertase Pin-like site-specific DNA recombinase